MSVSSFWGMLNMIDFILLVIVIVLAWAVCISILFHGTAPPTQSLTSIGFDFYSPKHIPIVIIKTKHNDDVIPSITTSSDTALSKYCKIHNYYLDSDKQTILPDTSRDLDDVSNAINTYAVISKPFDDIYQSLEPLIQMANGAEIIITDSGNNNNNTGRFIPDLLILQSSIYTNLNETDDSILNFSYNIIDEEVRRFYLRPLSRNLATANDNIHLQPLSLREIINIDHHKALLSYGCPVRIGRLCIISGSCIYKEYQRNGYIPYPRSKHENGLACCYKAAIKPSITSKIPKIIHQTYETVVLPHCITQCMDTWLSLNPEYEYKYYTTEDCRDFIASNFPQRILSAYDTLYPGAYKSDLWRCCVLYIQGGIYADIKLLPAEKLIKFIDTEADLLLTSDISLFENSSIGIFNAFMGAVPRHPLMLEFVNAIVENVEKRSYEGGCLDVTGPTLLGRLFSDRLRSHNISLTSRSQTVTIDGKVFDDNTSNKIQMLSLQLFPAIFDTAISSVKDKILIYRRNPYNTLSYDKNVFHHTSGKPHYLPLYRNQQVYIDNIYPIITSNHTDIVT